MRFYKKITILNIRNPEAKDVNENLQYLGSSLGLFGIRDKDKSCFRIFIELLKSTKKGEGALTSDDLAMKLNLSRGTVIHHINKLMDAGIVVNDRNKYFLREDNLELLIKELRKDMKRMMDDLEEAAGNIDKWMGL